jgi:hypothetical protein
MVERWARYGARLLASHRRDARVGLGRLGRYRGDIGEI